MKELAATGMAEYQYGEGTEPDSLTLSNEFSWLLPKKDGQEGDSPEDEIGTKDETERIPLAESQL